MRSPRALAGLMIAGLVISACGARLPSDVSKQAKASVLNQTSVVGGTGSTGTGSTGTGSTGTGSTGTGSTGTGSTGSTGTGSTGTGSTGTGSTGTGSTGTGSTGTGSTKTGSGKTNTGTGTTAASCNSASISGPGVSSSGINIGTVADVTGPVSGLFTGAEQGIEAFANYVNATQGGICGHPVHVQFRDGGTNCTQNENGTSSLINSVFAFVGTFSLYDNCGATIIKAHPNTPDIHVALDPAAATPANHFDLEPGSGYQTGPFAYYAHKYGSAVKAAGTIYEAIPSAEAKQNMQIKAAEQSGWHFVYQQGEQPTNGNFETDFVKMCQQQHIKVFFTVTEDAQNAAEMIQNEKQAGCPSSLINVIPIAYDSAFVSAFSGNESEINGVQGWSEYALFFNANEAAKIPAVATFQQWFKRTYPGQPINLYAMYAWADGLLFQQAMENAGSKITQAAVIAALRKVKNFTGGGIVAPATPSSKTTGITCYIVWSFANGAFNRSPDDPAANYRCDGRFVQS